MVSHRWQSARPTIRFAIGAMLVAVMGSAVVGCTSAHVRRPSGHRSGHRATAGVTPSPGPAATPSLLGFFLRPGGFFSVDCAYGSRGIFDPIVFPDLSPAGHLHHFFGNSATGPASTATTLSAVAGTTCRDPADRAAYWSPAAFLDGRELTGRVQNEYWRDGGFDKVGPMPFGASIVAGKHSALGPQPTNVVYYYCGEDTVTGFSSPHRPEPYDCSYWIAHYKFTAGVIGVIVFPQCWDGVVGDPHVPHDDTTHFAYPLDTPTGPTCPPGFPHVVPRLEEHIHFGVISPYVDGQFAFWLSSGPYYTLHGDFIDGWKPSRLNYLIEHCITGKRRCSDV